MAQIRAANQPMTVQPRKKLSRNTPRKLGLLWATIVGRKYSSVRAAKVSMREPPVRVYGAGGAGFRGWGWGNGGMGDRGGDGSVGDGGEGAGAFVAVAVEGGDGVAEGAGAGGKGIVEDGGGKRGGVALFPAAAADLAVQIVAGQIAGGVLVPGEVHGVAAGGGNGFEAGRGRGCEHIDRGHLQDVRGLAFDGGIAGSGRAAQEVLVGLVPGRGGIEVRRRGAGDAGDQGCVAVDLDRGGRGLG